MKWAFVFSVALCSVAQAAHQPAIGDPVVFSWAYYDTPHVQITVSVDGDLLGSPIGLGETAYVDAGPIAEKLTNGTGELTTIWFNGLPHWTLDSAWNIPTGFAPSEMVLTLSDITNQDSERYYELTTSFNGVSVPEPSAVLLVGLMLAGSAARRWR